MQSKIKINNSRILILLMVVLQIIEQTAISFYPYSLYYVIDNYRNLNLPEIVTLVIMFFISVIIIEVANFLFKFIKCRYDYNVCVSIRKESFEKICFKDFIKFHRHSFDYYSSFLINDVDKLSYNYYSGKVYLWCKIKIIIPFVVLSVISWRLSLVLLVTSFFILFVPAILGKKFDMHQNEVSETNAVYLQRINEFLSAHDFMTYNGFKHFFNLHMNVLKNKENATMKSERYHAKIEFITGLMLYLQQFLIFSSGMLFVYQNLISVGIFTSALVFSDTVVIGVCNVAEIFFDMRSARVYRNKVISLVNEEIAGEPKNENGFSGLVSSIRLENISVQLSGIVILHDISLFFESGKKYFICGGNGSGKTTLLEVIMSVLPVSSGNVVYNGLSEKDSVGAFISYVPQDRFVFQGTIYENVVLFDTLKAGKETVRQLSEMLNLGKDIDEQTGRNGEFLSGGQIAKICLMRALLRKFDYLILDEPFNAVDKESKADIIHYLMNLNCTLIMVSHNLEYEELLQFDSVIVVNGKTAKVTDLAEISSLI